MTSPNLTPEVDLRRGCCQLEKGIWRHNSGVRGPIWLKFGFSVVICCCCWCKTTRCWI